MNCEKICELLSVSLDLDRDIIGVKFLETEEDFKNEDSIEITKPFRYCVMIKSALSGKSVKINKDNFKCNGSGVTFGYWDVPKNYFDENSKSSLHRDSEVSLNVKKNMYIYDKKTYGMVAKPLNMFKDSEPDVVIMVTNSYNAMRIAQGYTYNFGLKKDINIAGNEAICLETTLVPIMEEDMNISMLCAGTRYAAGWKDDEVSIGISKEKINGVVDGLINTINTIEPNYKKKQIISKNGSDIINGVKITMDSAYFYSGTFL